jgi:hypothetical protein
MPDQVLGTVWRYSDLHRIMRDRALAIGISREVLDDISGLPDGYSSKLLAATPIKHLGELSMGEILPVLGMKLLAVEDKEALRRTLAHSKYRKRNTAWDASMQAVSRTNGRHSKKPNLVSRRFMRKIARLGGAAYAKADPEIKRRVAQAGAAARWHKPKVVEIKTKVKR